jgi:Protein of unknown function (DUF3891)
MLLREDSAGVLAIGQPSHAWISGQLARAWGNAQFGEVQPREAVCLAAEQHDVGWQARDLEPLLNTDTGLPRSFMEMPLDVHLGLFTDGPRRMVSQSRYAALLVSMHGWRLYARRDLARFSAPDRRAIEDFLRQEKSFQATQIEALRADPVWADSAGEELIERNSLLVWTWDYLSLALCLNWIPATAKDCPTSNGRVDLQLLAGSTEHQFRLAPWPFSARTVGVACEGRRLAGRYTNQAELRSALPGAPWQTLRFELIAG